MKKIALRTLSFIAILLIAGLVFIKLQYGGGKLYPDVSTAPLIPEGAFSLPPTRLHRCTGLTPPQCLSWSQACPSLFLTQTFKNATKAFLA
jgi:hypothetical protein